MISDFKFQISDCRIINLKWLVPGSRAFIQREPDEHAKHQADDETDDESDYKSHSRLTRITYTARCPDQTGSARVHSQPVRVRFKPNARFAARTSRANFLNIPSASYNGMPSSIISI